MGANIDMQDHVMQVPQGRTHLRYMPMYGPVLQHFAPDPTTQGTYKTGTTEGAERDREGRNVVLATKRGDGTGSPRGGEESTSRQQIPPSTYGNRQGRENGRVRHIAGTTGRGGGGG